MYKIIAIGNQLMCDDGIAITVLNEIEDRIKQFNTDFEIICGETDYMYCLDSISKGDVVIIVDSSLLGESPPGTVQVSKLNQLKNKLVYSSQHQVSLPDLIHKYNENLPVYTISIEVAEVDYQYGLSNIMKNKLNDICEIVLENIEKIIKEHIHA